MNAQFDVKKFRELLLKGIGSRTQKEFAKQVGMSPVTINRMLNSPDMQLPKQSTLEVFARNMRTVSLKELCDACGYQLETIENNVRRFESFMDYFTDMNNRPYLVMNSINDLIEKFHEFFVPKFGTKIKHEIPDISIPEEFSKIGAENVVRISFEWIYESYFLCEWIDAYYTETKLGKIMVLGFDQSSVTNDMKEKLYQHGTAAMFINNAYAKTRMERNAEEKLLETIFGHVMSDCIPTITPGFGFEVDGTPENFLQFLYNHADTFCHSHENSELYKRVVEGEDPEIVFKNYKDVGWGTGCCAVIASIMEIETGCQFFYHKKNDDVVGDAANAAIMCPFDGGLVDNIEKEMEIYLYNCARELGIKQFGTVLYHDYIRQSECQVYNTEEYYLCYK